MKKVDIIIPAYNSHKTIERALASILMQNLVKDIRVLIVNDAGKDYNEIVESFKNTSLDIVELTYSENGGPSKARNFGLDNATAKYIMFLDSDDCFSCPWSVSELVEVMDSDEKLNIVTSAFEEEKINGELLLHKKALTFTHGKIYRRAYLEKHKIRFNEESRSCEDMSFNMLVMLLLSIDPGISANTDFVTYYWMNNSNSIGRLNKDVYDYSVCTQGYIYNLLFLFKELRKRKVSEIVLLSEKIASTIRAIECFSIALIRKPEFRDENMKALLQFYNEIYKPIENKVKRKDIENAYKKLPQDDREVTLGIVLKVWELLKTNPNKITLKTVYEAYKREIKIKS